MTDSEVKQLMVDLTSKIDSIAECFITMFGKDNIDVVYSCPPDPESFLQWYRHKCYLQGMEGEDMDDALYQYFRSSYIQIVVYWSSVKVVNVNAARELSHTIKDLYAKVYIDYNGRYRETLMNRTTFTLNEWKSNYVHSHLPKKSNGDSLPSFNHPCFGQGPIVSVINTLKRQYDLDWWGSFVLELARYVGIESTDGGPYIRLDSIISSDNSPSSSSSIVSNIVTIPTNYVQFVDRNTRAMSRTLLPGFIPYLLEHYPIPTYYNGVNHNIAMDPKDFWLLCSNAFIEWYNSTFTAETAPYTLDSLLSRAFLNKAEFKEGQFRYIVRRSSYDSNNPLAYRSNSELVALVFRGKKKLFNVLNSSSSPEEVDNTLLLLNTTIIRRLIAVLQFYINAYYGYEQHIHKPRTSRHR